MSKETKMVTLTIDDREVTVPAGSNVIDAAKALNITIPHFCFHHKLPVAGNCRMCQVKIAGQPKLTIACNTTVTEGMKVATHHTSPEVAAAQRAILEFLLINHPLDCTVCDQAGHCKLQDYFYEFDLMPSRFTEAKEQKQKAQPLGQNVIYDAERCILCTRCVRFCQEVTKTAELGVMQRGDKSYIGVANGAELNNPFSGTVCDLCPVGALTHRPWRFNTRIWFTNRQESICAGCSAGCRCEVAVRDNTVVQVKALLNEASDKGGLCDEGRYGFMRFQPTCRLTSGLRYCSAGYVPQATTELIAEIRKNGAELEQQRESKVAVFLSPYLTKEELESALAFIKNAYRMSAQAKEVAFNPRRRALTQLEALLMAPDYAPNLAAAQLLGMSEQTDSWEQALAVRYEQLLKGVRQGDYTLVAIIGDYAISAKDLDAELVSALRKVPFSWQLGVATADDSAATGMFQSTAALAKIVLPALTINEKSGTLVKRGGQMQRLNASLTPPPGAKAELEWLELIAGEMRHE